MLMYAPDKMMPLVKSVQEVEKLLLEAGRARDAVPSKAELRTILDLRARLLHVLDATKLSPSETKLASLRSERLGETDKEVKRLAEHKYERLLKEETERLHSLLKAATKSDASPRLAVCKLVPFLSTAGSAFEQREITKEIERLNSQVRAKSR